jgi:hypothetical protein
LQLLALQLSYIARITGVAIIHLQNDYNCITAGLFELIFAWDDYHGRYSERLKPEDEEHERLAVPLETIEFCEIILSRSPID